MSCIQKQIKNISTPLTLKKFQGYTTYDSYYDCNNYYSQPLTPGGHQPLTSGGHLHQSQFNGSSLHSPPPVDDGGLWPSNGGGGELVTSQSAAVLADGGSYAGVQRVKQDPDTGKIF